MWKQEHPQIFLDVFSYWNSCWNSYSSGIAVWHYGNICTGGLVLLHMMIL